MKLKTISLALGVASLAALYILAIGYEPGNAVNADIGKVVWFEGRVRSIYFHKKGHVFLTLENEKSSMKVVIFSNVASKLRKQLSFTEKGDWLLVKGRLSMYKGKPEIIVRKPSDVIWLR